MAIWQFKFTLVPDVWLNSIGGSVDSLFSEEGYDASPAWEATPIPDELEACFSTLLPKGDSWDSDLTLWGDPKSHDIQLWMDNGLVESIDIRLDLRVDYNQLLVDTLIVLHKLACSLVILEAKLAVKPELAIVLSYLYKSSAFQFASVSNRYRPLGFLSDDTTR